MDWGSCQVSKKYTTDYGIFLGDSLIDWKLKKQAIVARSLAEAEYIAISAFTSELLWRHRQLFRAFVVIVDLSMVTKNQVIFYTGPFLILLPNKIKMRE